MTNIDELYVYDDIKFQSPFNLNKSEIIKY